MAGVNKVILLGYVGADPEVRHLEGGTAMAKFRIATSEAYKDKNGQRVEHTEWHSIVAWRGLVEIVEKMIRKGTQVYIEGKLRNRQWEDKTGNKHHVTEIFAESINIIQQRRDEQSQNKGENDIHLPPAGSLPGDNLPF